MHGLRFTASVWVCLLLLSAKTLLAQVELNCPALVDQALTTLAESCPNMADGMVCYGHKTVTVETNSTRETPFAAAADQISLSTVAHLATVPVNPATGEWGLAAANLLPADAVTSVKLLLMGDASLTLMPTVPTSLQVHTGFTPPACVEAPSTVALLAAADTPVALNINGIDSQLSGMVVLQQDSLNAFKAVVHSGLLSVTGGTPAQAGQTIAGVMDNTGVILFWSAPRPSTDSERQQASLAANAFSRLGVLVTAPLPPEPTAIPTGTPSPALESCGSGVTHVVQPGENLFRIALRYNTTIDAIVQANGIADMNQIVVGTTLVIPCGVDSGTSSVAPGASTQPTAEPAAPTSAPAEPAGPGMTIDCGGFNGQLPPNAPPAFQDLFNQFCQ